MGVSGAASVGKGITCSIHLEDSFQSTDAAFFSFSDFIMTLIYIKRTLTFLDSCLLSFTISVPSIV